MRRWEHAWLTGATGGLGKSIAYQLAREKRVRQLTLLSHTPGEAERTAKDLAYRYGIQTRVISFNAEKPRVKALRDAARKDMPSLVILTHGIMPPEDLLDPRLAERICRVNTLSMITLTSILTKEGFKGDLVFVSSVAALRAKQRNALYGMSKAALTHYAEAVRQYGRQHGVHVLEVRPGILKTRMSEHVSVPLKEPPQRAARHILTALDKRKHVLYTPGWWYYTMLILRSLPARVYDRMKL